MVPDARREESVNTNISLLQLLQLGCSERRKSRNGTLKHFQNGRNHPALTRNLHFYLFAPAYSKHCSENANNHCCSVAPNLAVPKWLNGLLYVPITHCWPQRYSLNFSSWPTLALKTPVQHCWGLPVAALWLVPAEDSHFLPEFLKFPSHD